MFHQQLSLENLASYAVPCGPGPFGATAVGPYGRVHLRHLSRASQQKGA